MESRGLLTMAAIGSMDAYLSALGLDKADTLANWIWALVAVAGHRADDPWNDPYSSKICLPF
ncbi:hypothetical protein NE236_26680 [Actinoallomurus purpureus]|uniref:hypothetical protein n=1 Tax=Actinoallomurus purpureus TaxID=478114 RepID=UPI002092FEE3|nr:hypothetical protein [Actinoallomurus purpureus]MCO6008564.1 hypothetical protein [Actinoallomurus purpureus]